MLRVASAMLFLRSVASLLLPNTSWLLCSIWSASFCGSRKVVVTVYPYGDPKSYHNFRTSKRAGDRIDLGPSVHLLHRRNPSAIEALSVKAIDQS
jgi:hypothetical protein